jgi:hypothetical protein
LGFRDEIEVERGDEWIKGCESQISNRVRSKKGCESQISNRVRSDT